MSRTSASRRLRTMLAAGLVGAIGIAPRAKAMIPVPLPCLAEAAALNRSSAMLTTVPADRLAVLARGVNVTNLFGPQKIADIGEVFRGIRAVGLRHVRIPISPLVFAPVPPAWQADVLSILDAAVCEALRDDLGVILDLHPSEPVTIEQLADVWRQLAQRYAGASPDRVFLELLNEPKLAAFDWDRVQTVLAAVVRLGAPANTLIATASPWSTAAALTGLSPLTDRNVVYAYHFYTPMVFTHQGAEWSLPPFGSVRGLQFPASPDNARRVTDAAMPALRAILRDYLMRYRLQEVLVAEMALATAWARRWDVPLIVSEFGVFGAVVPQAARAAWRSTVSRALEARATGWTVWEYEGGFAIAGELDRAGCARANSAGVALGLCRP